jgi:hypothetical protein
MVADVIQCVRLAADVHDIRICPLHKANGCAIRSGAIRRRAETSCGLGLYTKEVLQYPPRKLLVVLRALQK